MPDWIKTAKEAATKTVISPLTQRDFVIRKLTSSELIEAGMSPLINEKKPEKFDNDLAAYAWVAARADTMTLAQTRCVITQGIVNPQVVYGDEKAVADGQVHARWIAEDETWLFLTVLEFSGIASDSHREQLQKLLKNENGSATSLPSAVILESSPANC